MDSKPTPANDESASRLNRVMEAAQSAKKVSPEEAQDNAIGMRSDGEFIRFNEEPIEGMEF